MAEEKTEEPTDKKLKDAKRDGKAPKSTDIPAAALFLLGAMALSFGAEPLGDHLRVLMRIALDVGRATSPQFDLQQAMTAAMVEAAWILVPLLGAALLLPMLALVAQIGINITFKPLELKIDAINPASGLKRIFSVRSLLDLVKMIIKAAVLIAVLYKITLLLLPLTASLSYQPILDVISISWMVLCRFVAAAGLVVLILGGADFGIQYWLFIREHRMTKDEIKREHKESEGDPQIKGKRKQIAREDANAPPQHKIADAQVVVVNPTHYAVAIRYMPGEHGLPRVIAKGVDEDALEIRRHAEEFGVPIVPNAPLARALYLVPLHQAVPDPLFEAVAEVLAWVGQMQQINQPHGADPGPSAS
ncbi:type III secretion system export apparatus subunit SctU [Robbsia sp. Bb-Pol-6]|uniref:Type III secretion system export apparatus subunit SctU n=1 Tax=Robbsia betulipollinis TaxID=2981849 RepID=A0ABT3ZM83_9BURK|nr:type III secretion system export apparatus subunit SctU [Robbsia betulipollinis]MCY0387063.1 type III secretion system export apparatus subunit SctU [Robbsia betulipollinis]